MEFFHRSFSCVFSTCNSSLHPSPKRYSLFVVIFFLFFSSSYSILDTLLSVNPFFSSILNLSAFLLDISSILFLIFVEHYSFYQNNFFRALLHFFFSSFNPSIRSTFISSFDPFSIEPFFICLTLLEQSSICTFSPFLLLHQQLDKHLNLLVSSSLSIA